jgi:hypothetical protein
MADESLDGTDTAKWRPPPDILVLALGCRPEKIPVPGQEYTITPPRFRQLTTALIKRHPLRYIFDPREAVFYLAERQPVAIIVTDSVITKPSTKYRTVAEKVGTYVKQGGVAIFMGSFGVDSAAEDMNSFFKDIFNLPWTRGGAIMTQRSGLLLNHKILRIQNLPPLFERIELSGISITNVNREHSQLYGPLDMPSHNGGTWTGERKQDETLVALEEVQEGWIGYCGDGRGKKETNKIIFTMCRLGIVSKEERIPRPPAPKLQLQIPERADRAVQPATTPSLSTDSSVDV